MPAFFSGNHLCHIWSASGVSLCIVADNVFGRESQIRRSPWKKTQETVQEEEAAQEKGDCVTRLFCQRNVEIFGIFWYYLAIWYHRCMWYVVFSDQIIIVASFPSLKSHCYIDKKNSFSDSQFCSEINWNNCVEELRENEFNYSWLWCVPKQHEFDVKTLVSKYHFVCEERKKKTR